MNLVNYFKETFESIKDYRIIVVKMFSIKNVNDLLTECGFLKDDNNRLSKE